MTVSNKTELQDSPGNSNNTPLRTAKEVPSIVIASMVVAGEEITACGPTRGQALIELEKGFDALCASLQLSIDSSFNDWIDGGDVEIVSLPASGGFFSKALGANDDAGDGSSHGDTQSAIRWSVLDQAYGFTLSTEGEIYGLIAGDHGYEPTGLQLDPGTVAIWQAGVALTEKETQEGS